MDDLRWAVRDGRGCFTLWYTEKRALEIQASYPGSTVTPCELVSDPSEVALINVIGLWFNEWAVKRDSGEA